MSNDLQTSNINRNIIKKSVHSVSYKNGEKYYNFDSIKLVKRHISISEKNINLLKNIIFYILGGLTVILFYIQPNSANDVLHILKTIKENIFTIIYFITPYARCDNEYKWLYLVNTGLIMSVIATFLFFILNSCFSFIEEKISFRFFISAVFFFSIWYILYGASFCIIRISKLFKILSIIVLLIITLFLFFAVMCILDVIDQIIMKKEW